MHKFILHWGEMGPKWGVNRTIAQIHALLYVYPAPVTAEQLANTLAVARSNVSTSIRLLQAKGLVKSSQRLGDRKDYYELAEHDVWAMFKILAASSKRRGLDPVVEVVRSLRQTHGPAPTASESAEADLHASQRLAALHEALERLERAFAALESKPVEAITSLSQLAGDTGNRRDDAPATATSAATVASVEA